MNSVDRRNILKFLSMAGVSLAAPLQNALAAPRRAAGPYRKSPLYTVVVDAGHGGVDPGCIGHIGTYEKDVVLDTALKLARSLEASKRYKVSLSRSDDTFVSLEERVIHARAVNADLFLSVHADALPEESARGASVFTLSEKASDKEAAMVAARENASDRVAGVAYTKDPEVNEILFDLARRETNNLSIRLANELVAELGRRVRLLRNTHRSAAFVVLKAPDIPSALVETGCLSNPEEERDLRRASYRQIVAGALLHSVNDYFDQVGKGAASV